MKTIVCALMVASLSFGLIGCGENGIGLDAAKGLVSKALEQGKAIQSKLGGITDVPTAEAAKDSLGGMASGFSEMFGKVNALPTAVKSGLGDKLGMLTSLIGPIKEKAASLLQNDAIKGVLGPILTKLTSLGG